MIILQLAVSFLVGFFLYMLAMVLTVYDGLISMIFQPIIGSVFSLIGVGVCFLVGLPIRLIRPLKAWWRRVWWLPLVLGMIAFLMLVASWHPSLRIQVYDLELGGNISTFNPGLALGGWLLSIFAALHFYPPIKFRLGGV
jgi:hypothetical protein